MKRFFITKAISAQMLQNSDEDQSRFRFEGNEDMQVSDGYHTMDELYDHRITLFITLCRTQVEMASRDEISWDHQVWRSKVHHPENDPMYEGWFVMGIGAEEGKQITYHLPLSRWEETSFAETLNHAPAFDGHLPADVLERLKTL